MGNGNDDQEDPMPTTPAKLTLTVHVEPFYVGLMRAALAVHGAQRLDFTISEVGQLDNQGAPCEQCDRLTAAVTMQAYYRNRTTGRDVMTDGCATCIVRVIAHDADPERTVRIEVAR